MHTFLLTLESAVCSPLSVRYHAIEMAAIIHYYSSGFISRAFLSSRLSYRLMD